MAEEVQASPLFAAPIPVRVKMPDRDEVTSMLTACIRLDRASHSVALIFELTDESDPFFYFSLNVGEGDFHSLKAEQRLLVDFQTFPSRLVDLLQTCLDASGRDMGAQRMTATFVCSGTNGVFSVVESNQFKELTHIGLCFRKGTDESVKQYLAAKMQGFKGDSADLSEKLRSCEEGLGRAKREIEQLTTRIGAVTEEKSRLEHDSASAHQREIAELKEQHAISLAEMQRGAGAERAQLEAQLRELLDVASARAEKAERSNDELRQGKFLLESSEKHSRDRLQQVEAQLAEAQEQVRVSRTEQKQLELTKFQHEKQIAELQAQLAGVREQLSVKENIVQNHTALADQANSQRASVEDTLAIYKQQAQQMEEKFSLSTNEIAKGNQIIQTLQTQLKQMKAKLRLKATALAQQEKVLLELEREHEAGKRAVGDKEQGLDNARQQSAQLEREVQSLKDKLAEAHGVIKSNQEVIEYLNRQLTERDLKGFNAAPDRFSMFPGAPPSALTADVSGIGWGLLGKSGPSDLSKLTPGSVSGLGRYEAPISGFSSGLLGQRGDAMKDFGLPGARGDAIKDLLNTAAPPGGGAALTSTTSSAMLTVPSLDGLRAQQGAERKGPEQAMLSNLGLGRMPTTPKIATSPSHLSGPVAYRSPSAVQG